MKRKNNNKNKYYIMLAVLLLTVTLGYALLTANLSIKGLTSFKGKKWKIYWDNVEVTTGSVAGTAVIDNDKKTSVTVNAILESPDDFYEFTVDAKNDSDFDAMIDTKSVKIYKLVEGEDDEELSSSQLPNYLKYSFTYADGKEIVAKQFLEKNTSKKYRVRVEIDGTKIDEDNLPSDNLDLKFVFSVTYAPADNTAVKPMAKLVNGYGEGTNL